MNESQLSSAGGCNQLHPAAIVYTYLENAKGNAVLWGPALQVFAVGVALSKTTIESEAGSSTTYSTEGLRRVFLTQQGIKRKRQKLSIDLYTLQPAEEPFFKSPYGKWEVQVLLLTENRMRLFIPQEAEVVELRKTAFSFP